MQGIPLSFKQINGGHSEIVKCYLSYAQFAVATK